MAQSCRRLHPGRVEQRALRSGYCRNLFSDVARGIQPYSQVRSRAERGWRWEDWRCLLTQDVSKKNHWQSFCFKAIRETLAQYPARICSLLSPNCIFGLLLESLTWIDHDLIVYNVSFRILERRLRIKYYNSKISTSFCECSPIAQSMYLVIFIAMLNSLDCKKPPAGFKAGKSLSELSRYSQKTPFILGSAKCQDRDRNVQNLSDFSKS